MLPCLKNALMAVKFKNVKMSLMQVILLSFYYTLAYKILQDGPFDKIFQVVARPNLSLSCQTIILAKLALSDCPHEEDTIFLYLVKHGSS